MKTFSRTLIHVLGGALVASLLSGCSGGNASFTGNGTPSPSATLVKIEVSSTNPRIALGTTAQFTATGIYSDNASQDLTASVVWSSSSTAVSTVSNTTGSSGLASAVAAGSTTITATSGVISGGTLLTVTSATLVSVQIAPANPRIALGTTRQFTAMGVFSDNSSQDLTASVTWNSSSTSVAMISTTGLATSAAPGSTTITATSGVISGSTLLTVTSATLVSIQVSPTNPSIAIGTTRQFTATGVFSDGSSQDLTASVTWSSSSNGVAAVSTTGLAASAAAGSTTITATSGSGAVSGSTLLTVTSATLVSLQVAPTTPSIALGMSTQFTAMGIFSDNSSQDVTASVTWGSSDAAIAVISNTAGSKGLGSSVAAGSATITAAAGTVSGSTLLTVTSATLFSVQVTPTTPSIALGMIRQFTAIGIYSDNSTQDLTASVTWSSSNTAVAAISSTAGSKGLASSVAAGSATITATSGAVSGSTLLTVTSATLVSVQVAPTSPSIALGTTRQFTATGIYSDNSTQDLTAFVTWSSSNTAIAAISSVQGSNGLATSVAAGSAMITASSGAVSGSTLLTVTSATLVSIQVSPTTPSIALGLTRQFTATGIYSDSSTQDLTASVTWRSSNGAIATVSNAPGFNGLATSIAAGSATITATSGVVSGSTLLTVTSATLVSIQVAPATPSIALGMKQQFTATGIYSDNSSQDLTATVTWGSSDAAIAVVSNTAGSKGLASSVAAGSATISATSGSVSGSTTLSVTSAVLQTIDVAPTLPTIALGTQQQFIAIGTYSDNTTQDLTASVTWSSSSTAIAMVSNTAGSKGLASSVAAGSATITAASGAVSGSSDLTVTSATLVSVQVSPTTPSIARGTTQQFTAMGVYSDNSIQDITAAATWSSSNPAVAAISNAQGSNGLAKSILNGSAMITATLSGVSGSTSLTVTSATLVAVQVSPTDPIIALGMKQQFTALGVYSDNSIQDLTATVTWSSSDTAIAVISNAKGSNGLATAILAGSSTITATAGTVSDSITLTVISAVLQNIDITPVLPTIALGTTQQFIATGTYSDDTTADLTAAAVWSSSSAAVATVSNAPGYNGLTTSLGAGTATITATLAGVSGSTDLTVTTATLSSIQITPTDPSLPRGLSEDFSATGAYSDGSVEDLTELVTWTSSNTNVATVSNAPGSKGFATTLAAGSTVITAKLGSVSGTSTFTVINATLSSIAVTPATAQIARGTWQQFTAIATFSDLSTQDVTASAVWTSSNTAIATISNTGTTRGLASGSAAGVVTITATFGGMTNTASLTVTPATLSALAVAPTNTTANLKVPLQYTATGTFNDTTKQDLTTQATWRSSRTTVATISNTSGSKGLATPVSSGTSTITASARIAGISRTISTGLTVTTGGVLVRIDLTAYSSSTSTVPVAPPTVRGGNRIYFTATGVYSNGVTQNLTTSSSLTWSSSNTSVAYFLSNRNNRKRVATYTTTTTKTVTIKAQSGSIIGSVTLTVTP